MKLGQNILSPRICLKYNICKIENFMISFVKYIFFDIIQSNHEVFASSSLSQHIKSLLLFIYLLFT